MLYDNPMKTRYLLFIFLPAILIVAFALFIRLIQYEPLYPNYDKIREQTKNISALDFIPIFPEDPILGSKKAAKTIIAFEDLGCSRCTEQMKIFQELTNSYPNKIKVIWKGLSVTRFPQSSEDAHKYAYCANKQNMFAEFENLILESNSISPNSLLNISRQANLNETELSQCLSSGEYEIYNEKNEQLARSLGIGSVPTIFIDNQIIQDPLTIDGWKTILSIN